ncbi:unnamed protein product [Pylaiella littoralis]
MLSPTMRPLEPRSARTTSDPRCLAEAIVVCATRNLHDLLLLLLGGCYRCGAFCFFSPFFEPAATSPPPGRQLGQ